MVMSASVGCAVGELCVRDLRGRGRLNAQHRNHAVGPSWHSISVFPEQRRSFVLTLKIVPGVQPVLF